MPSSSAKTSQNANPVPTGAFNKQTDIVQELLKNFSAIFALNAPGPAKIALEELINSVVCNYLTLCPFFD